MSLLEKLKSYPAPPGAKPYRPSGQAAIGGLVVPLKLAVENGTLCFLSTTTEFATALDINLSELVIETLFPADPFTADTMRGLAQADPA